MAQSSRTGDLLDLREYPIYISWFKTSGIEEDCSPGIRGIDTDKLKAEKVTTSLRVERRQDQVSSGSRVSKGCNEREKISHLNLMWVVEVELGRYIFLRKFRCADDGEHARHETCIHVMVHCRLNPWGIRVDGMTMEELDL